MKRHYLFIILTIALNVVFLFSCDKTEEPSPAPTKEGHNFAGWFTYDVIFIKWNFASQAVTNNTTLFARWIPVSSEEDYKKITVSLIERDDYSSFEKMVILLDNDHYLIKTPLIYFLGGMNNLFGLYQAR